MNAPLRFCASQGCTARVPAGRCPTHTKAANARPGAHGRGYTRHWQHFRAVTFPALLVERGIVPACGAKLDGLPHPHSRCQQQGILTVYGLELDHEPPLQDWERAYPERVMDLSRVGYLCRADHSRKTLAEMSTR